MRARPALLIGTLLLMSCAPTADELQVYGAFIDQIGFPPSAKVEIGSTTLAPNSINEPRIRTSLHKQHAASHGEGTRG